MLRFFFSDIKKLSHKNVFVHEISNHMCVSQPSALIMQPFLIGPFPTPLIIFGIHLWILTNISIPVMSCGDQP